MNTATQEDKLVFIDFYTTWCAPCKELDQLVFQNDSIKKILGQDFVLLKYDAEKDKEFHLSKKHHVSSYPTAIILSKDGYVINRKYGFPGDNFQSISQKVLEFTQQSIDLHKEDKFITGYSNKIVLENYPQFYIDYVNRDNTDVEESEEFKNYWASAKDPISEEYFSTLIYFASDAPPSVADISATYKTQY